MPEPLVQVDASRLRALSRDLRSAADGKARRKTTMRELKGALNPLVADVRGAIMRIPSRGESARRGRRPLRAELSRSVSKQVRLSGRKAGVSVFMNPRKMPHGKKAIPQYMEAVPGYTRWRHPVYGPRGSEPYVSQSAHPYFSHILPAAQARGRAAVARIVERTARDLEG